jgi:hypothetical protein
MSSYDIKWSISPELDDASAFELTSSGLLAKVKPFSWKENTVYKVSVKFTYINEPEINSQG